MTTLFSDNAQGYLSETAEQSATVFSLSTGEGIEFPDIAPGSGDQFFVRIGTNLNNDVIRIVDRVGDLLYPDVPLARRWPAGTEVALTVNTRAINALRNEILSVVNDAVYFRDRSAAVITSSGNFTRPEGVSVVKVTAVGGGGGGGGAKRAIGATGNAYGGRGGYGTVRQQYVRFEPSDPATIPVTIGSGGAAGSFDAGNGGHGNSTMFGTYFSANGGTGGMGALATGADEYGDNGASFVGEPIPGLPRWDMGPLFAVPHSGIIRPNVDAPNGIGYGAPGMGAIATIDSGCGGGYGTPGIVIVEW